MSSETMRWVWRHSPYTGVSFTLHVAMADVANEENGGEFWMNPAKLARKARTTRETASRWLWQAVDDGIVDVVDDRRFTRDGKGYRERSVFRFKMPQLPMVYDPDKLGGDPRADRDPQAQDLAVPGGQASDEQSQGRQRRKRTKSTENTGPCDEQSQSL